MYVAKMPDRRWAPPLLGAAATGLLMVLDRGRAHGSGLESLVHDSASNIGDPWPSVVAARRLLDAWHAPIYADFSDAGSSFIYPPLAALPYSPFAHASYEGAHAGIAIVSRACFVAILALALALAWDPKNRLVGPLFTAIAACCFYPLLRAVELNQATLLSSVFIGASLVLAQRGRIGWAGVACALAATFKPQLALVVPLVAIRSRRFGWTGLAAFAGMGIASLVYGGFANHVRYLSAVLPRLSGGYAFYPNQSWSGTLLRLDGVFPYDFALHQPATWIRIVSMVLSLATLAIAVIVLRRETLDGRDGLPLSIGLAWLFVTLASPISWEHHYVPAIFVLAILVRRTNVLACVAIPFVAGYFDVNGWSGNAFGRLAMSYLLAGAIVLTVATVRELTSQTRAPASPGRS